MPLSPLFSPRRLLGATGFAAAHIGCGDLADRATRVLPDQQGSNWAPQWSPDGSRLAFLSDRSGTVELYVMKADGTEVREVSAGEVMDQHPVWRP